jgi:GNAT superfamily N-acetyltransferase
MRTEALVDRLKDSPALEGVEVHVARAETELPTGVGIQELSDFLSVNMKPYDDSPGDTRAGVEHALAGKGFVICSTSSGRLTGALVMLDTGMKGFVPPNLLLFVAVDPSLRGKGLGTALIKCSVKEAQGDIKLHVEPGNPATHLYQRLGFRPSYLDMRLKQ